MTNKVNQQKNQKVNINESINLRKSIKNNSYKKSKVRLRKQLPKKNQRILSSIVHADGMDTLNDLIINTIGRPLSIISGSVFALISTVVGVYYAKKYGFYFNYFLFFLFFILGYVSEIILELCIKFFVNIKK
jgi:hypothetical protein